MKKSYSFLLFFSASMSLYAQVFIRSELPTPLSTPWEITYGPDNFLWATEAGGRVLRIDPSNGDKTIIYTAPDYFSGSALEKSTLCYQPSIGYGTLGLTLHPDFLNSATSFIYYVYSYNSGTTSAPATKFKIKRLTWNASSNTVVNDTDIVTLITTGFDHLGGRLMAIKQGGIPYLFLTVGDHGISETNYPDCYSTPEANPNRLAQDPTTQNGKTHRFNIDGSIPSDNPVSGNSFYTRGHRNPQGLMYNPNLDIIYNTEHGDRTDDEINILKKGMNYGWKYVRGYNNDNNFPGESDYISNYIPYSGILNDSLAEAFYSFCATVPDSSASYSEWCTVAPSDGIYYGSTSIPEWTNSLLLVTLKNGVSTDMEVYRFKLQTDGKLVPSTLADPNPKKFFGADQALNGRLRDIAVSADGKSIYLINNFGTNADKITVYTYDPVLTTLTDRKKEERIRFYPNPSKDILNLTLSNSDELQIEKIIIYNTLSQIVYTDEKNYLQINTGLLKKGLYTVELITNRGNITGVFLKE